MQSVGVPSKEYSFLRSFLISNDGERISGQTIAVDGNAIRLD